MILKKVFSIIAALLFAGSMMAADKSVQKSVHDLFPDDPNGTQRVTLYDVDGLTIFVNKKGNNGKIYNNSTVYNANGIQIQ